MTDFTTEELKLMCVFLDCYHDHISVIDNHHLKFAKPCEKTGCKDVGEYLHKIEQLRLSVIDKLAEGWE